MLSPTQLATLHALMDRIIPPDQDPGAWEAGGGDYFTRQLAGDLRDQETFYRVGLDALEAEALAGCQASFVSLTAAEQDALLRRVEAGDVAASWPINAAHFFEAIVVEVIHGYYSDPGNGGNRDAASWRMIGYGPTKPEGQPR